MVSFATSGRARHLARAGARVDLPLAGGPDTTMNGGRVRCTPLILGCERSVVLVPILLAPCVTK